MTQNIQKLFKNLENVEPSAGLEAKILWKIEAEKGWQAKKRLIFADALTLGSAGAFIFILLNFSGVVQKSEFWSLLKLAYSDTATVASFWKDFTFSLLETFPAAHIALILVPVFLLMLSLNIYFNTNNHSRYNHIK